MLTLDEFVTRWTGKIVDTDGIYPNECMDLMHQYLIDCFGYTDPKVLAQSGARFVYENFANVYGNEKFTQIPNTPTNVPEKGDIFFFGKAVGVNGHVCIVLNATVNSFTSFDANWDAQTYGKAPRIVTHTYLPGPDGALGWLHPRQGTVIGSTITIPTTERDYLVGRSTVAKEIAIYYNVDDPEHATKDTIVAKIDKSINAYKGQVSQANALVDERTIELAKANQEVENRKQQVSRLEKELLESRELQQELSGALKPSDEQLQKIASIYEGRISALTSQLDETNKEKGRALLLATEYKAKAEQCLKAPPQIQPQAQNNWIYNWIIKFFTKQT